MPIKKDGPAEGDKAPAESVQVFLESKRAAEVDAAKAWTDYLVKSGLVVANRTKMLGYGRDALAHYAGEAFEKDDLDLENIELEQVLKHLQLAREGTVVMDTDPDFQYVVFALDVFGRDGGYLPGLPFSTAVPDYFLAEGEISKFAGSSKMGGIIIGVHECEIDGEIGAPIVEKKKRLCFAIPCDALDTAQTFRDEPSKRLGPTLADSDDERVGPATPPSRRRMPAHRDLSELPVVESVLPPRDPMKTAELSVAEQTAVVLASEDKGVEADAEGDVQTRVTVKAPPSE